MSRELSNCYEVLGVSEGASARELKEAYRDLAKVWHPDRFAHDPRLQQKAQEKLKEINEAYEQLASGKASTPKRTSPAAPPRTQQNASRAKWRSAVLPVCVFTFVLLVSGYLLIAVRAPVPPQAAAQETESSTVEQTLADGSTDTVREPQRAGRKPTLKQPTAEVLKRPIAERAAGTTPLPTVSLTIDTTTGLIATAHCPVKSRMTYADGTEPRQHCFLHKADQSAPPDPSQKDSRLKSFTRRLASPTKWFRDKEKSDAARRETPASQNTAHQD